MAANGKATPMDTGADAAAAPTPKPKKKPSKKKKAKVSAADKAATTDNAPLDSCPRAAREILTILKAMGAQKHDPRVVVQLLEFSHRYIHDVLEDATCYAEHRASGGADGVTKLTKEDVRLAVQSRVDFSYSAPPPREYLMEVASNKNMLPLPAPSTGPGIRLPPTKHCLVKPNYTVLPSNKKAPPSHGPWYLPGTQAAVEAAKEAKRKRKRRKHVIEEDKERDEQDTAAQVATSMLQQTTNDEDDFDA